MAKRLLLNALRTTFADYIVGLTDDKLRLGVWSGEIELLDLQVSSCYVSYYTRYGYLLLLLPERRLAKSLSDLLSCNARAGAVPMRTRIATLYFGTE
jgi:hypothetical protein